VSYTTAIGSHLTFEPGLSKEQALVLKSVLEDATNFDTPRSPCSWTLNGEDCLVWDGMEGNGSVESCRDWLKWLQKTFFDGWGQELNGDLPYQGEETGDFGYLLVREGEVSLITGPQLLKNWVEEYGSDEAP
jgi:hypothetical protein